MNKVYKTEAMILRRRSVGEADRIFDIYTPNLGRLRLKAKGVRRIKSKLAGHLEMMAVIELVIASGRQLDVITGARNKKIFTDLSTNLQKTSLAFFICELVFYLTEEGHRDTRLYRLLESSLSVLNDSPAGERRYWRLFLDNVELQMLSLLGFKPEVAKCARCGGSFSWQNNKFSSAHGGIICRNCRVSGAIPVSPEVIKVFRLLLDRLIKPSQWVNLPEAALTTLHRVLKNFIAYTLERQMKTERFLELAEKQVF